MSQLNNFHFPVLTIQRMRPLLQKDGVVFAYEIEAETQDGFIVSFYENKGLDLSSYIGKKLQCLLEITRGRIAYQESDIPGDCMEMEYQWQRRLFEFFPELMATRANLSDANDREEISIEEEFESQATRMYSEWGLNGLNIGIYQTKPIFSSSIGHFLLNEYEFEEDIDALELNQTIYVDIEEMFLRGIGTIMSKKELEFKRQEGIYQIYQGKEYSKEEWRSFLMSEAGKSQQTS